MTTLSRAITPFRRTSVLLSISSVSSSTTPSLLQSHSSLSKTSRSPFRSVSTSSNRPSSPSSSSLSKVHCSSLFSSGLLRRKNSGISSKYPVFDKAISSIGQKGVNLKSPDTKTYTVLIGLCRRDPQYFQLAHDLLDEMNRRSVTPNKMTYTNLLNICRETEDYPKSAALFNEMLSRAIQPDVVAFNVALVICALYGPEGEFIKFYNNIRKYKVLPNVNTYNDMMYFCGKMGDYKRVDSYFEDMKRQTIRGNVTTFNILINVAIKKRKSARLALSYLDEMQKAPHFLKPVKLTYHLLISGFCDEDNYDKCLELFDEIKEMNMRPREETCFILLTGLSEARKATGGSYVKECFEIFHYMKIKNLDLTVSVFNLLMEISKNMKSYDTCANLYQEMIALDIQPDRMTFNALMGVAYQQDNYEEMGLLLKKMYSLDISPSSTTYEMLMSSSLQHNDGADVLDYYFKMKSDGTTVTTKSMNDVLCLYAQKKNFEHAHSIFNEMELLRMPISAESFNALIGLCAENNNLQDGVIYFRKMKQSSLVGDGMTQEVKHLIEVCKRQGKFDIYRSLFGVL